MAHRGWTRRLLLALVLGASGIVGLMGGQGHAPTPVTHPVAGPMNPPPPAYQLVTP